MIVRVSKTLDPRCTALLDVLARFVLSLMHFDYPRTLPALGEN